MSSPESACKKIEGDMSNDSTDNTDATVEQQARRTDTEIQNQEKGSNSVRSLQLIPARNYNTGISVMENALVVRSASDESSSQKYSVSNLQDMLRISSGLSSSSGTVDNDPPRACSPERRQFFMDFLAEGVVNETRIVQKSLEKLREIKSLSKTEIYSLLDSLKDLVESYDLATDFMKYGGFDVIIPLIKDRDEEIMCSALHIIATVTQNHPDCQVAVGSNYDLIPTVINLLNKEHISDEVCKKLLFTLSAVIQNNVENYNKFFELEGLYTFLRIIEEKPSPIQLRACFILSCFMTQFRTQTELCAHGFISSLTECLLKTPNDKSREHILQLMVKMMESGLGSKLFFDRYNELSPLLRKLMTRDEGKYQFKEEAEHAAALLDLLNHYISGPRFRGPDIVYV